MQSKKNCLSCNICCIPWYSHYRVIKSEHQQWWWRRWPSQTDRKTFWWSD